MPYKDKQKKLANNKKWKKNNPDKVRQAEKRNYKRVRERVFELLGSRCTLCGFEDKRALQVDHINGGGRQHRKALRVDTVGFWRHVLQVGGVGFQTLCANCNLIKGPSP